MQVKETKNYNMFSTIGGNRPKNQLHLSRLKKSMEEELLVSPIIVNENYEVIDGQHRLQVSKELNLPVRFIICEGYGLDQVHRLNQNSKNWTLLEFAEGYAKLGNKEYQYLLDFMTENELGLTQSLLLIGSHSGSQIKKIKNGTFTAVHKERGEIVSNWIQILKGYSEEATRRVFIGALTKLYDNPNFEFSQFISKIAQQPSALIPCVNTSQYIVLIEEIYNYRSRNKVNLRY